MAGRWLLEACEQLQAKVLGVPPRGRQQYVEEVLGSQQWQQPVQVPQQQQQQQQHGSNSAAGPAAFLGGGAGALHASGEAGASHGSNSTAGPTLFLGGTSVAPGQPAGSGRGAVLGAVARGTVRVADLEGAARGLRQLEVRLCSRSRSTHTQTHAQACVSEGHARVHCKSHTPWSKQAMEEEGPQKQLCGNPGREGVRARIHE